MSSREAFDATALQNLASGGQSSVEGKDVQEQSVLLVFHDTCSSRVSVTGPLKMCGVHPEDVLIVKVCTPYCDLTSTDPEVRWAIQSLHVPGFRITAVYFGPLSESHQSNSTPPRRRVEAFIGALALQLCRHLGVLVVTAPHGNSRMQAPFTTPYAKGLATVLDNEGVRCYLSEGEPKCFLTTHI